MHFKYLLNEGDILKNIIINDYMHEIKNINILGINIKTLIIKPIIDNNLYEMQPIILESPDTIKNLMEKLWVTQSSNHYYLDNKNISLKNQVVFSKIIESIKFDKPSSLLDIGYGNRSFFDFLKSNKINIRYVGVDLLGFKYEEFETVQANANILPFEKNSFELVNISLLLLNTIDPLSILNEVNRVLKKNAIILITDINSKYYKATGIYIRNKNKWDFIRVIDTKDIFFTVKTLGRKKVFFHAFHSFNLYKTLLENLDFLILEDTELGLTEGIIEPLYSEKIMKSFSRDLQYPSFHFLKAQKIK